MKPKPPHSWSLSVHGAQIWPRGSSHPKGALAVGVYNLFVDKPAENQEQASLTPEEVEMIKAGLTSAKEKPLLTGQEVRTIARAKTKAWKTAEAPKKSA
jgi:hypothetical protein